MHNCNNLEEIGQLIENYKLPKLIKDKIDNLNSSIIIKSNEKLLRKAISRTDGFTRQENSTKYLKTKLM